MKRHALDKCMNCGGTPEQNLEANLFAVYLLVPDSFLAKEPPIDLTNDKQVNAMAKKYKVPVGIMAYRLGEYYGQQIINKLTAP